MAKFIFRESFDTYTDGRDAPTGYLSRWTIAGGFAPPTLQPGRFLGKSLRCWYGDLFFRPLDEPASQLAIGFSCLIESMASGPSNSGFLVFMNGAMQPMLALSLDVGGKLYLNRLSHRTDKQVIGVSAPGIVQPNVWNFYEMEIVFHNTAGECRVYMNGDPEPVINVSGVDTMAFDGPCQYLNLFWWGPDGTAGVSGERFDDMYVWDEPIRKGPIRIESLVVNSNGAHQDFSPSTGSSNAACIDETVPDVTDYVIGTAPGQYDQYGLANLSSSAAEVFEVNVIALGQQTGSTIRAIALGVESGAVVSMGDDIYMGSGFARYERRLLVNPETGVKWTKAEVDAMIMRPQITV